MAILNITDSFFSCCKLQTLLNFPFYFCNNFSAGSFQSLPPEIFHCFHSYLRRIQIKSGHSFPELQKELSGTKKISCLIFFSRFSTKYLFSSLFCSCTCNFLKTHFYLQNFMPLRIMFLPLEVHNLFSVYFSEPVSSVQLLRSSLPL